MLQPSRGPPRPARKAKSAATSRSSSLAKPNLLPPLALLVLQSQICCRLSLSAFLVLQSQAPATSRLSPLASRAVKHLYGDRFRGLDRWIRMRLRCMKFKRKSLSDNGRIRLRNFRSQGLLFLSDLRPAPT